MTHLKTLLQDKGSQRLAVVGFPWDENSSFMKGAALAPPLIREAFYSDAGNLWNEAGIDLGGEDVLLDVGDFKFPSPTETLQGIEDTVGEILAARLLPICLGGDHAITYPIMRALHNEWKNLDILQLDAHPDLYDEFQGNRYSNACPFARILENRLARRLVQVGIRAMTGQQLEQARRFGVEVISMKEWGRGKRLKFDFPLYISFDMDVLDPGFAPGVSHREAGGLSTREVLDILQDVEAPRIVGADIVEFNPRMDPTGVTAAAAAKVLKEIAARMNTLPTSKSTKISL